ncbi:unnamed protein product [Nippostrongylus brasiliensis]|uniref:Neur_chan_LBD domain-containing protein n=1 Tax=Nippostrongylus brasiliensis TaxID=27835 RepID=A0A0N4Y0R6_NIPBR|nr:unnamed protein product [Nippostrongylus brasiliensis]
MCLSVNDDQMLQAGAVRGALVLKKSHQQSMDSEDNSEELEDLEEEEELEKNELSKASIYEQGETRDFLQFLRKIKYDHRQCPDDENGGPVSVNVSDYSIEMFYREAWRDPRLKYSKAKFKNKSYSNFLWHPDTFVPNAIASKNPRKQSITHRSLLRLRNDGSILYSRRLSLVVTCGMDLTLFPFDSQLCKLGIESYGYTADQVRYAWSHGRIRALILHKIRLPDFKIKESFVTSRIESYATADHPLDGGGDHVVGVVMDGERDDMISIILTITFLLFSYNEVMPRVSYIKAMDVYLGVCFCIVFCSLIKLAIVKYMRQRLKLTRLKEVKAVENDLSDDRFFQSSLPQTAGLYSSATTGDKLDSTISIDTKQNTIEFTPRFMHRFHWISQMTFFFGFVLFCLFYFLVYPNIHTQVCTYFVLHVPCTDSIG